MSRALYNREILRLAASIPHLRRLEDPHGSAERRSAVCGSAVAIDVRMGEDGRIAALGQDVKACALGQAAAALMAGHAEGRSAADLAVARDALRAWLAGEQDDPGEWPGLSVFSEARAYPARHASILLPFETAAEAAERAGKV